MKMITTIKAAIAACGLAFGAAQANTVSVEKYIAATDPGSVQYVNFNVSTAGSFNIAAQGRATLGSGYNSDPQV